MFVTIIILVFFYHGLFFISIVRKNNSHVDIGWGLSYVLLVFALFYQYGMTTMVQYVAFILIFLWGSRLAIHLGYRQWGQKEDHRYALLRQGWGSNWLIFSYLWVYLLQLVLMLVISTPLFLLFLNAPSSQWGTYLGGTVALFGLCIEVISDEQLRRFKLKPQSSRFIESGLWAFSRHPNYFGEACFWWGIGLLALPCHLGWLGLISPILVTLLVRFISGVPMLEKRYENDLVFKQYATRVPIFFPTKLLRRR